MSELHDARAASFVAGPVALDSSTLVMADVQSAGGGTRWRASVRLARPAGSAPIQPGEVGAELVDAQGSAFSVVDRPSSEWVEAGGAAGTTASAAFEFDAGTSVPASLKISRGVDVAVLVLHRSP